MSFSSEGFLDYESKTRDFWINLRSEKLVIDWGKSFVWVWESGSGKKKGKGGELFARVLVKRRRLLLM